MAIWFELSYNYQGKIVNSFINVRTISTSALVFVLLLLSFCSFEVISPSERGVKVTLGTVSSQEIGPGVQMKLPMVSHFETVSAQPITQDVVIHAEEQGAVSSDNQTIGLTAKVAWRYDTSRVVELVTKYPNRSTLEDLVNNTTYEALKAEIGKYTIFDLAKNAGKIATDARTAATLKVKDYPVIISQVNLTNWDWSKDFDDQIKATMNTQQKVAQAKAEADRIEQVQRAKSIEAEASARANIATAEGDKQSAILRAEAKKAEGEGIAAYNRSIAANLDTELKLRQLVIDQTKADAEKIEAQRWNGIKVPDYLPLTAAGGIVQLPAGKQ